MKIIERNRNFIGILLLTVLVGAVAGLYWNVPERIQAALANGADGRYTCPMHPQIVRDAPGACPECGMQLVALSPDVENPVRPDEGGCCGNRAAATPVSPVAAMCPHMAASTNAPSCPEHPHP